jgi:hypothetical protein
VSLGEGFFGTPGRFVACAGPKVISSDIPSRRIFVSVASRGFSDFVSGLESTAAEYFVNIDFKGDTGEVDSGALRIGGVKYGTVKGEDPGSTVNP